MALNDPEDVRDVPTVQIQGRPSALSSNLPELQLILIPFLDVFISIDGSCRDETLNGVCASGPGSPYAPICVKKEAGTLPVAEENAGDANDK